MNFRERLEQLDDQTIVALGNHELIDFSRIDILLEQTWITSATCSIYSERNGTETIVMKPS